MLSRTLRTASLTLRRAQPSALRFLPATQTLRIFSSASSAASAAAAPAPAKQAVAPVPFLQPHDTFEPRHIGPRDNELKEMLAEVGVPSLDALVDIVVPKNIRRKTPLKLAAAQGEVQALEEFRKMMSRNKIYRNFIGTGYYECVTPKVILRNILENPGWYTPYTPYSGEIAQGRMEMLLNYQTMVCDLTGMHCANASLLDEGTAAAEAMNMCRNINKGKKVFLISTSVHPQTAAVCQTRAYGAGGTVIMSHHSTWNYDKEDVAGVLLQYPADDGNVEQLAEVAAKAHAAGVIVCVASDLLALTMLKPPGEWGADIVFGNAQRFGVPLGFGGPHAAFFATSEKHKRLVPGRIIGVSRDAQGKMAFRMAMQTREQHIRRDKATSNICTAQALLANIAAAYGVYHGPKGLKAIAQKLHNAASTFATTMRKLGFQTSDSFFDTVRVGPLDAAKATAACAKAKLNIRLVNKDTVCVSFGETVTQEDILALASAISGSANVADAFKAAVAELKPAVPSTLLRTSPYMTHAVFNSYHAEHEMLRYLFKLQSKDLSLQTAMIPLGSCTMKLNATSEMIPVTWPEVGSLHPFAPLDQSRGYQAMLKSLAADLCEITGFAAVSLQPNSGSQGEYAGLMVIRAYHESRGDKHRNVCLIPTSAHGTNPASAAMCNMKVVVVACDKQGNIDIEDLKKKAEEHKANLSAMMLTYPSTHGVFEEKVQQAIKIVHDNGGQVYMDGANMNAQVGLCSPGGIGADVCHLNLHKTFCIPHGGGGPGMGPIGVARHLVPFLPSHPLVPTGGQKSVGPVCSAPYGSASILPISYMYIRMMGGDGLKRATQVAILSANYMAKRLEKHYPILYRAENGTVAHEFIVDIRPIKAACGISEEDVAKRLMDYNFHAPTMSFPVPGTLMIEPTESESKYELDRFCDAMISIREEIREVETGKADKLNNVLKHAPHTAEVCLGEKWDRPYSRERGAYPLPYLRTNKFWPTVSRIDNVYGDRHVVCSCPPIEAYMQPTYKADDDN